MSSLFFKLTSYFSAAKSRASKRKSPWNLLLIPLSVASAFICWFLLTNGLLSIQQSLIPASAILSSYTRLGSIIIYVVPIFPAIGVGLICANMVVWLIPKTRKIFDEEAQHTLENNFIDSIKALTKTTFVILCAFVFVSYYGIKQYFYVKNDGIYLGSISNKFDKHYYWSDIKEIHTSCLIDRRNLEINFIIVMSDNSSIDLMNDTRLKFIDAYYELSPNIKNITGIVYSKNITSSGVVRIREQYGPELANNILKILNIE